MRPRTAAAPGGAQVSCVPGLLTRYFLRNSSPISFLFFSVAVSIFATIASAQVNVLTYHNDSERTGRNLNETTLTPSNVNPSQFGKLFSYPVNGWMLAQPLIVENVPIAGQGTHDTVYVASYTDDVYAFDADTNGGTNANPLWHVSLLTNATSSGTLTLNSGVWGTPAIDLSTNTMYLISSESEGSAQIFRLHALDIRSGKEQFGGPVQIQASVSGTGSDSTGGVLSFDAAYQRQRPALLVMNHVVYMAFGSYNDEGPYHGWLFSYSVNQSTQKLQQNDVYCTAPNGSGAGIWMGGAGIAGEVYDPSKPYGRIFVTIANGTFSTAKQPYSYGMTVLDFDVTGGTFTLEDSFTPYNAVALSNSDADLGSSGPLLLPAETLASGKTLNPLLQIGKAGMFYLLDRDNNNDGSNNSSTEYSPAGLGGFNANSDQVVEEFQTPLGPGSNWGEGVWGSTAYFHNRIYSGGTNAGDAASSAGGNTLQAYSYVNGVMSTSPTSQSAEKFIYPGPNPSISANNTSDGVVWALMANPLASGATDLVLLAYNANNLGTTLYSSNTNASRDDPGHAEKYTVPTVANGMVYVGASGRLNVYGLLDSPTTPKPVISPGSGKFSGTEKITITDATAGATIYYTTDGTPPSSNSAVYSASTGITISSSETIKAIASAQGYIMSAEASATYTSNTVPPVPVFSLAGGTYIGTQSVMITDSSSSATIYYTLDGKTPSVGASDTYTFQTDALSVSSSETVSAIAVSTSGYSSATVSNAYVIEPAGTIDFTGGFTSAQGPMTFNGSTDLDDFRLQLTNGGTEQAGSAFYATPVNIQAFSTSFTIQQSNPTADGMTFTIQNAGATAIGAYGGGLGYQGIGKSVAIKFDLFSNNGEGPDSTGLYTNGASPTTPAIDLSSTGINLHSGDYLNVTLTYDGSLLTMTLTDAITMATWTRSFEVNIPSIVGGNTAYVGFTGGTGSGSSSQKVSSWLYEPQPLPTAATTFALGPMTLNGGADFDGSRLELTDGGSNEARSAFLTTPVNVQEFTSSFEFQLTSATADGFTFTIQGDKPTALGGRGGGLGYSNIAKSVAVKFDLYSNSGEGSDSTGLYINGASPTVPATGLTSSGVNLHNDDPFIVQLSYDGTTLTVVITDMLTGASAAQSYSVNIPSIVGGSKAYAGFTAGDGGATSIQKILTWTYTATDSD